MKHQKIKTSKSALKRFKISGTGKVSRRHVKLNHFNAKADGSQRRDKRGSKALAKANEKDIKNLMPYLQTGY